MSQFDPDESGESDGTTTAAFRRLATIDASLTDEDFELVEPPESIWEGITSHLHDAPVVQIHAARRRTWVLPASIAAAAALLAGVTATILSGDSRTPSVELASAGLEVLKDVDASAEATLVKESDGKLHLVLNRARMPEPPAGSYYEIWLVDSKVTDPRSLSHGAMATRRDFAVPSGLDPASHPVVDISVEPDDGNPGHSGADASVLRGTLTL